jgi:hypothetical protein
VKNESENILTLFASFGEREVRDELCNGLMSFWLGEQGMDDSPLLKGMPECRARSDGSSDGLLISMYWVVQSLQTMTPR